MKKILAISLAITMLAVSAVNAAGPFTDVRETDWFCYYAQEAKDKGILAGYPDGTFRPDNKVSCGEFLAMVLKGRANPAEGHWAAGFYSKAEEEGLLGNSEVSPRSLDTAIPRKDMAEIMAQVLKRAGLGGVNAAGADTKYTDVAPWDSWEYSVALCSHYGVLSGYPDGTFRPMGYLKRSEAAAAMLALESVIGGGPGASDLEEPVGPKDPEESGQPGSGVKPGKTEPQTREELLKAEESLVDRSAEYKAIETFMDPEILAYINSVTDAAKITLDGGCRAEISWPGLDLNWGDDSRFDSVKLELRVYGAGSESVAKCSTASYMDKTLRTAGSGILELDSGELSVISKEKVMLYVSVRRNSNEEKASGYIVYDIKSGKAEKGYLLKGKVAGSETDAGYDIQADGIPASSANFKAR